MVGPFWCVKAEKYDMARRNIRRILPSDYVSDEKVEEQIALIQHTINLEKQETAGATFRDCFRGSNLRRTEIVRLQILPSTPSKMLTVVCRS